MQKLDARLLDRAGVTVYVKREDLTDPELGGNKWRKLKYNLLVAESENRDTLLTFGGAWSNHIYSTAAAGKLFGFDTIGIIRGESSSADNPTLRFAAEHGMRLEFVDRQTYRNRQSVEFIDALHQRFGNFYLVPEGGSNTLALKGCAELGEEIKRDINYSHVAIACGTGATFAGIVSTLSAPQTGLGFAALKGGGFLRQDITGFLTAAGMSEKYNWQLITGYHFGGYARTGDELLRFIRSFKQAHDIQLDAVYTGKLFYGLWDMIGKGQFKQGSVIVAVHTGGLQGNRGFGELL